MANSTMMHALDFDDTLDVSALHTFVNVLPAALAAAEDVGNISGRQLITALVVGVDIIWPAESGRTAAPVLDSNGHLRRVWRCCRRCQDSRIG